MKPVIISFLGLCLIFSSLTARPHNRHIIQPHFNQGSFIDLSTPGEATILSGFSIGNLSTISFAEGDNSISGSGIEGSKVLHHPGAEAFDHKPLSDTELLRTSASAEAAGDEADEKPVELVQFGLTAGDEDVSLFWVTASEKNNLKFEIERSTDGESWLKTGEVAGAGNSNSYRKYRFTDKGAMKLATSKIYYRLHQVGYEGDGQYSEVQSIETGKNILEIENAWHNRTAKEYDVDFIAKESGQAEITLLDINGRVLEQYSEAFAEGHNNFRISLNHYPTQFMILMIKSGHQVETRKIMK